MTARVSGYLDNACPGVAQFDDVAVAHGAVDPGNEVPFASWTYDDTARRLFQGGVAAGMIEVMMRVEDMRQRPTPVGKCP